MHTSASQTATQRRLILIRHAKAVAEGAGDDHTRTLSERGQGDAAALGQWLSAQGWPQLVYCSTATRTRQTLAGFSQTLPTILSDKMYLASATELLSLIQASDDDVRDLMLVGHNPGMHGLLALLVGEYAQEADADKLLLKFPTSACGILSLPAAHWRDVAAHSGRLETLRY